MRAKLRRPRPVKRDRQAEKLPRAQADDDVEDVLGVGDHGFPFGAGVWVVRQPPEAWLVVEHAHGHLQEVAEAMGRTTASAQAG